MATADAGLGSAVDRHDALLREIEASFLELNYLLDRKKNFLLERVTEMKQLCQKHGTLFKAINQLEGMKRAANEVLTENLLAENKEQVTSMWDNKINDLKREKDNFQPVANLKFVPNTMEISKSFDKIHLRDSDSIEYRKRREPVVMKGEKDIGVCDSRAIAIDRVTGQIFVVELHSKLVSIYSKEGDFIKSFGDGILSNPYGICLTEEFAFITNRFTGSVSKFKISGDYINDSKSLNNNSNFDNLNGLCADNQFVYVCHKGKNSIELFDFDLLFIRSFGEDKLDKPQDIRIQKDQISVLTLVDKLINIFSRDFNFISSIKLIEQNPIIYCTCFFSIDQRGNFIVADEITNCLKIYSPSGECLDSLGCGYLYKPKGIEMDSNNRIVTISSYQLNFIQIY